MPPGFTAAERERITSLLKQSGRALFATRGLRKTSLDDLVAPAAIAKSTFYLFFTSKEELYMQLLLEEAADVRLRTIDDGLNQGADPRDALRRYLRAAVTVLAADPLYHRLATHPEDLLRLNARLDSSQYSGADNGVGHLTQYIVDRQGAGELPDVSPSVIVGVLRAVLLLPLHAQEFGEEYDDVLALLIDVVTAGLTAQEVEP